MLDEPVLEIKDLQIEFTTPRGVAQVVNGPDLSLTRGQMHGLVGESGSGKSVTSRAILGLLPQGAVRTMTGEINYRGRNLLDLSEAQMRNEIRGREISMVFQDPMTALAPTMRIGEQIMLPMRQHERLARKEARARMLDLLEQVGIPDPVKRSRSYPNEMSGGQRQRVMIACALSCSPKVLVADEPTTALDVTVQSQILDLFASLREERDLTVLLVSHDLTLIAERCHRVAVMYAGGVVEKGPAKSIFGEAQHPYTRMLEEARPRLEDPPHTRLKTIPGSVVDTHDLPVGCAFAERCPGVRSDCLESRPQLLNRGADHPVACFHPYDRHLAEKRAQEVAV